MRNNGVLAAISSLPSPHGIGDLGPGAFSFVDYLSEAGVNIWQILPFNRLGYGNSPYQTLSSIAGDEIFLSLDILAEDGYLKPADLTPFAPDATRVDYEAVRRFKAPYFKRAFSEFQTNFSRYEEAYTTFLQENPWTQDYSVFLALHGANDPGCWTNWPPQHRDWPRNRDPALLSAYREEIAFQQFLQFLFYGQWVRLKAYANAKKIEIMGDIPFYVGLDSVDVWTNRQIFLLDEHGKPTHVAGVPPDYFEPTGQRWGNPLYDWEALEREEFAFWIQRLRLNQQVFDSIRIDHFRAFDTYWKIPAAEETAIVGTWEEAPGYAFFNRLFAVLPDLKLVAEDLGDMRPEVFTLRDHYQFTGMLIIQFLIDRGRLPRKKSIPENKIVYTGTHDNQTTLGWFLHLPEKSKKRLKRGLNIRGYPGEISDQLVQYALNTRARTAVIPLWDILGLDDSARINTPGTVGSPNWEWKLADYRLLERKIKPFAQWLVKYGRVSKQ